MDWWPSSWPNPIDVVVAILILLYALQGFQQGWLLSLIELLGFIFALFIGLTYYAPVARLLITWTGVPYAIAKPVGFLLLWVLTDLVYGLLVRRLLSRQWWRTRRPLIDRLLGVWPGAVRGVFVAMVLLTIVDGLPFPDPITQLLGTSRANRALQPKTAELADRFNEVFGDAVQETIGLLTVKPESNESVSLQFKVAEPSIDPAAEVRLFELLNGERTQRGLRPLQLDEGLRDVARAHSIDMFQRGYFAHVDPDGCSPFDRMRSGGVRFRSAGENLALAPTVDVAHTGLMNSPGHRENILKPEFGRVGIGVADGGLHGKMFTENFAD